MNEQKLEQNQACFQKLDFQEKPVDVNQKQVIFGKNMIENLNDEISVLQAKNIK